MSELARGIFSSFDLFLVSNYFRRKLSRSILALRHVDVHMQHCRWCGPSFFGAAGLHRAGATHAMSVPALACADLDKIKASAAAFRRQHPLVEPDKLRWGERIMNREARDAYTMS